MTLKEQRCHQVRQQPPAQTRYDRRHICSGADIAISGPTAQTSALDPEANNHHHNRFRRVLVSVRLRHAVLRGTAPGSAILKITLGLRVCSGDGGARRSSGDKSALSVRRVQLEHQSVHLWEVYK